MTAIVNEAAKVVGERAACRALGISRSSHRRWSTPRCSHPTRRRSGGRALSTAQREHVLATLHEPRFADLPVPQVHATLLGEGIHDCSARTMYRILDAAGENVERRNIRHYIDTVKPRVLATRPNELWSWDITKLRGPAKWTYFYLYVIIDVFSRSIVGWMVATKESKVLATKLIAETCRKHSIAAGTLTLHADRGSSMTSKPVAFLCADLGVTKTHSRPYQSNDNPYSEAGFKTLKYRPDFPDHFDSIEHARAFVVDFVDWYNHQHHHSGLAMFTPHDVHYGLVDEKLAIRATALREAYQRNPERFPHGAPIVKRPPKEVWINKPENHPTAHPQPDQPAR
jgi:putative transposase